MKMEETTFLRIVTIILLLFSLWVSYTSDGFVHDNIISDNTFNINVTMNIPVNMTENNCDCNKYYSSPYFNIWENTTTIYLKR